MKTKRVIFWFSLMLAFVAALCAVLFTINKDWGFSDLPRTICFIVLAIFGIIAIMHEPEKKEKELSVLDTFEEKITSLEFLIDKLKSLKQLFPDIDIGIKYFKKETDISVITLVLISPHDFFHNNVQYQDEESKIQVIFEKRYSPEIVVFLSEEDFDYLKTRSGSFNVYKGFIEIS